MRSNKLLARAAVAVMAVTVVVASAAPASAVGSFIDPLGKAAQPTDCRGGVYDPNGKGLGVDPNGRCAAAAAGNDTQGAWPWQLRETVSGLLHRLFDWF